MKFNVLVYLSLMSNNVYAHSHETCSMANKDSCWSAFNSSSENSSISCIDTHQSSFKTLLQPAGLYSYQFCTGWGDGLGYPEPGVVSKCSVELSNGKKVDFQITAIAWGNSVEIKIYNNIVTVKQSTRYPAGNEAIHSYNLN